MNTAEHCLQVAGELLPLAVGRLDGDGSLSRTAVTLAVQAYEELSRAVALHADGERLGTGFAEVHVAYLNMIATADVGDIAARIVAHALDAGTLVDSLCLLTHKGVQRLQRRHALGGRCDKGQRTVGVGCKLLHTGRALVAVTTLQFAVMVEQVVMAFELHRTAVDGKAVVGQSHHLTLILPRTGYLVGC